MRQGLATEFLISPRVVLAFIVAAGCILALGAELFSFPWTVVSTTMLLVIVLAGIATVVTLIVDKSPLLARWLTVLALSFLVHACGLWLHLPGALVWAVIPVSFAACLVDLRAAAIMAVVESAAVLVLAQLPGLGAEAATAPAAIVAIWAILLAMVAITHETRRQITWYADYFQHAYRLLDEALDHRAELVQTLDDLAHANRQLALLNKRVVALQSIAEEAQEAKTRFVARVSHEFRTPLNMIIGLTDLLAEKPEIYDASPSPRMRDALRIVQRNSQHLSDMVNDVLDLSRIETDHIVLHRERVAIQEIVEVAVEAVRPLVENKRLALRIEIAANVPEVYCDRTRIEQVVLNLVSNAVRYTDRGCIQIKASRQAQYVCVHVADTGHGIAPQDRERIFEPFSQGTSAIWRDKGGTGLGLSISKKFIELHDGRIWVESEVGAGTTFAFELPISPPLADFDTFQASARPGHKIQEDWIWHERKSRPNLGDSHLKPRIVVCEETGDLFHTIQHFSDEVEFVDTRGRAEAIDALRQAPAHALLLNMSNIADLQFWTGAIPRESKGTSIVGCSVQHSLARARALGLIGQIIKPITRTALAQMLQRLAPPVRRVLLVDDGIDELEMLSQMLWAYDGALEVVTAHDGAEALQRLRTERTNPPDLMLLDIVMPGMDGWQVLEAMASDDCIPKVPTFFVSAQDPYDRPPRSSFMLLATEDGLSLRQLLRCSLAVSSYLLQPEGKSDPALE